MPPSPPLRPKARPVRRTSVGAVRGARHEPHMQRNLEQYENNRIEGDHSRLKHRLRPIRGLRTDRTARVIIAGLALLQNLRRGHYELATEPAHPLQAAAAFTELASAI